MFTRHYGFEANISIITPIIPDTKIMFYDLFLYEVSWLV
jgi:hypothetical protein